MKRILVTIAFAKVLLFFVAWNCYGQEPESSNRQGKEGDKEDAPTNSYCPIYPYAYHGSYVSYYALKQGSCDQPASVDGPPNLLGNCSTGESCLPFSKLLRSALTETTTSYFTADGIKRTNKPTTTFFLKGVKKVKEEDVVFEIDGTTVYAKLFEVSLKPKNFEPSRPDDADPPSLYIGYQIEEPSKPKIAAAIKVGDVYKVTFKDTTYYVQAFP